MIGAGDHAIAGLHRLAQRIEHLRIEFGQLIQKQHAVMGKRNLARSGADAAADHGRHGGGMMRRAERPAIRQSPFRQLAADRGDHRHFQQFARHQRRQDRRQPRGQHRLAGTGRADHQQIVATGSGHFERPLGGLLPLDVGKVRQVGGRRLQGGLRAGEHLRAAKMVGHGDQAARAPECRWSRPPKPLPVRRHAGRSGPCRAHWRRWRPEGSRRPAAIMPSSDNSPTTT